MSETQEIITAAPITEAPIEATNPTESTPEPVIDVPAPQPIIELSLAVGDEIKRLHLDMVNKFKGAEAARVGFNEFIRGTRMALGIPSNELWELNNDATAFRRLPQPVQSPQPPQGQPEGHA